VLVGLLDRNDSLHQRATQLLAQMQHDGDQPIMLDLVIAETVSVLCDEQRSVSQDLLTSEAFVTRSMHGLKLAW
jgi:hypothetical protein